MNKFGVKLFTNLAAILIVIYFMKSVHTDTLFAAFMFALIITFINTSLKPAIILFTLPFNILSLGFFTLIINGMIFYGASKLIPGFHISDFWSAFWGALLFSIISMIINIFVSPNTKVVFYSNRNQPKKYKDVIDAEIVEEEKPAGQHRLDNQKH